MSLFPRELTSDRLRYEHVHPDRVDVLEYYRHCRAGAPEIERITEHLTWDPHDSPAETLEFVRRCGDAFEEGDGVTYELSPRDGEPGAGEFAGLASLSVDWDRRRAELGVWLRPPFWGRGYSGERAVRLADLAFDRLDLDVLAVRTDPDNEKSRSAIERYVDRLGGRREGRVRSDVAMPGGEVRDAIRWSVAREEWARGEDGD